MMALINEEYIALRKQTIIISNNMLKLQYAYKNGIKYCVKYIIMRYMRCIKIKLLFFNIACEQ